MSALGQKRKAECKAIAAIVRVLGPVWLRVLAEVTTLPGKIIEQKNSNYFKP
jgi:hypothetical protein